MTLADELAEKHCDTNHSERAASLNICTHCQFVAAINEALERAAQTAETDRAPYIEVPANMNAPAFAEGMRRARTRAAAQIRALKSPAP